MAGEGQGHRDGQGRSGEVPKAEAASCRPESTKMGSDTVVCHKISFIVNIMIFIKFHKLS